MALTMKTSLVLAKILLCLTFREAYISALGVTRKLKSSVNPQCDLAACRVGVNGSFVNVLYVQAESENDTLHYVFSSYDTPSLLVALTHTDAVLHFDWEKFLSSEKASQAESITFSSQPQYTYAVLFPRLLEYSDVDDKAVVDVAHGNNSVWHDLARFEWNQIPRDMNEHSVTFTASSVTDSGNASFTNNGSISFKFQLYGEEGRATVLPRLLYNANSSHLDFTIDHMIPNYATSRYALEMVMVTSDPAKDMQINTKASIDDEYTPGIFSSVTWNSQTHRPGAYMQWKPVCYRQSERTLQDATKAKIYNLRNYSLADYFGVVYAYYGPRLLSDSVTVKATNVSFGLSEDKFYTGSMYVTWSASIGYGSAIYDQVSLLIISIITSGLGLPVLIILFGGIGVCIKKQRDRNKVRMMSDFTSSQQTIN